MSALAYCRNPTANTGVLCDSNFEPLTLQGVRVAVNLRHGTPVVTASYEYRNQTASSQKVFAAFAVPQGWRVLSSRADASMGNNFVRTMPPANARTAAPIEAKGVAALDVPWVIMVGQAVVVQITFLAPPVGSALVLPMSLFPHKVLPAATAAGWRGAFAIQAPSKFAEGCSVTVEGQAALPLEGIPVVNGGNVQGTGTLLGDPKGFRLTFSVPEATADFNITFPYKQSDLQMQVATVIEVNREVVPVSEAFSIVTTLNPSFTKAHQREPNAEFIFVVGLGNGIDATAIDKVRDALHAVFAGLPASCNVNAVCCLGSEKESDVWMEPEASSVPVSADLLAPCGAGTAFLKQIAVYAHTETKKGVVVRGAMKRPAALIQDIISTKPFVRGLARNIVVITTDGGDTQASATSQMVVANRHSTSVSAVALEWLGACDIAFLNNLTTISNGVLSRCGTVDDVIGGIMETVSTLAVPALTQISLHYTDSNAPSTDGSSAPTVTQCGVLPRDIPFIRNGSDPASFYAFGNASIGQLTVKAEGLIGGESMQYVIKTPKEAIASSEQNHCAKGNAASMSPAHLTAAALRQDQLIRADGALSGDVARLTLEFGVPNFKSAFPAVDEVGVVADGLMVVATPNPLNDFVLGRKGAIDPDRQNKAISVVSTSSRPYTNVATDKVLQARLVAYGEAERRAQQAIAQKAFDDRKRREKAIGIDDQEAADVAYAHEQLQIDSIRNYAADYLGGTVSLTGGSTGPSVATTADFFRAIVEALVGTICDKVDVNKVLQSQQVDGSLKADSALTLAALGVTTAVLKQMPSSIANKARAADIWVTALGLARVRSDARAVLFQRKALAFLATVGVEPSSAEADAVKSIEGN